MSTTAHKIAVMKAHGDGAAIQRARSWLDGGFEDDSAPAWNWAHFDYRVKPPERKTVKLLAWFDGNCLSWRKEGGPCSPDEQRAPTEDKTIEIE